MSVVRGCGEGESVCALVFTPCFWIVSTDSL